jgi:hypothetical protein
MVFIKARRKQLFLAGSLAAAVTVFTVTACGGGGAAAPAQGSAPGRWTQAEVSSQLEGDAQAALDPNYDPPPADNADWVAAMNDYVTAGEDYSGDNTNEQDDNPAQGNQEIAAGNSALSAFNAANAGVLNGTIQS